MNKKQLFFLTIPFIFLSSCGKVKEIVGEKIDGDFNGDGKIETAELKFVKAKYFENDILLEYSVTFNDTTIKTISLENSFRRIQLINEGDLNEDNADDISISYEIPPTAPVSRMETRSFSNGKWNYIIQDMTIHFGFENLSSGELQNIVKKNGKLIEYYTYGNSFQFDNNFKPKNLKKKEETISLK